MDKTKQWVACAVLLALVLLTGGWFLVVAPERGEAVELREQVAVQEGTNAQLATSLEVLRDKSQGLDEKKAEVAEVARRIPAEPALPDLLRALAATASSAGVELTSVTPTTPSSVAPAADAAAAPAAPAAPADPAAAPAAPAAPTTGLSAIEVTMVVVGDFYDVEQFLVLLEELPRALRVTGLSMDPGVNALDPDPATAAAAKEGRSVQATVTGLVYLVATPGTMQAADPATTTPAATTPAATDPAGAAAPAAPSSFPVS